MFMNSWVKVRSRGYFRVQKMLMTSILLPNLLLLIDTESINIVLGQVIQSRNQPQ